MTAVEWLVKRTGVQLNDFWQEEIQEALEMEREQRINTIIAFQLFLSEHDYISNHLWDFEDMALKFLEHEER